MDVGYQAYSILKTGKDYHGELPGLVVHSFADYRAPLLIYITIPFVAIFGLTTLAVKLPIVLLGTLSVLLIYIVSKLIFKDQKIALIAAALTVFVPWNIQYSRIAYEAMLMLTLFLGGLIFFIKGLNKPKFFIYAAILFSLDLFAYNTMKLFIPSMIGALILINYKTFKKSFISNKSVIIAMVIFSVAFGAGLFGTIFQKGGQRFNEISIFTDPTNASQVNYFRSNSQVAYVGVGDINLSPRLVDKIVYNKPFMILDRITQNYLKAFSVEFLFIKGDTNTRHSGSEVGALFRIEVLTVLFGFIFLILNFKKNPKISILLLTWIALSPFASIITREGSNHATRLFMLFPALTITSALGVNYLFQLVPKKIKLITSCVLIAAWLFGIMSFLNFYFGAYTTESARAFQFGFNQSAQIAIDNKTKYDYVIIDDKTDSALMNYLFVSNYDPSLLQEKLKSQTLKTEAFKFPTHQIDNILLMQPSPKDWVSAFSANEFNSNYLLIVSAKQINPESSEKFTDKFTKYQRLLNTIYYKTGQPAFYVISSRKPEEI